MADVGTVERIALLVGDGNKVRTLGPFSVNDAEASNPEPREVQFDVGALPARPMCLTALSEEEPLGQALQACGLGCCTLIPLLDGHGVLGALALGHPEGQTPFSVEASVAPLATIGAHIGT
ncbi:MAG: hypothetical protein ACOC1F_11015, partial [Myxococcota bacterium]